MQQIQMTIEGHDRAVVHAKSCLQQRDIKGPAIECDERVDILELAFEPQQHAVLFARMTHEELLDDEVITVELPDPDQKHVGPGSASEPGRFCIKIELPVDR